MRRASLTALLLAGSAGGVAAQTILETPPEGSHLSTTLSERFEVNDNYGLDDTSPGTSYFADTRLGIDYLRQTGTQSLAFGLDTGIRALWEAEEKFDFVIASPSTGSLAYQGEWSNGAFDAAVTYRERRVEYTIDTDVTDPTQSPDNLDQLQGNSRELRYDANVGVLWGTSTPSTYELRFVGSQVDYTETNADQVARTTLQGEAAWNLQLTPVLASTVSFNYLDYSADNVAETELKRSQVGAGLIYTPDETLTLGGGVNYSQRKRTDLTFAAPRERVTTEDDSGPGLNGDFRYVLPDFVVSGSGEWSTASPSGGRFFGTLNGTYVLPRGRVTGRVFQTYTGTSSGGNEARVTGAALQLVRNINELSSFGLNLSYAIQVDVDEDGVDDPDVERMTLIATYSREITSSVSADVGYTYRSLDEDPDSASSNSVFFQLAKAFDTLR